ncbi:GMC family oxidoreductase [bacterium]|nr:GMC family oxidoreductase [bacterium]
MHYDVAIIGSGFGGGAAAYALSRAGLKTVLIERGKRVARDERDWDSKSILIEGRYRTKNPFSVVQLGRKELPAYFNEVLGGMSIFYGGAAFRLRESDFKTWPVSYADFEPYYNEAENLLEVHGSNEPDPTGPNRRPYPFQSIPLTPPAQRMYEAAKKLGYRPFSLPVAINSHNKTRPTCMSCFTCDGFPCKISAKNDVTTTLLEKANPQFLTILEGTEALSLVHDHQKITAVECTRDGTSFTISANTFIVSGGALFSPVLLLRSGLGELDASKALGHYLMRHDNAVVASVFPFKTNPTHLNHKQIAITSFYHDLPQTEGAVGVIQDMCMPPPESTRYHYPGIIGRVAAAISEHIQGFICIAEDDAQYTNAVSLKDNGFVVHHQYSARDDERLNYLVGKAKTILRKAGGLFHNVKKIDSFSHALGTARFGNHPNQSVLNPYCRFHALNNLFVVDGSFMPTSGGVNPSLTITANALRVAKHIKDNFQS